MELDTIVCIIYALFILLIISFALLLDTMADKLETAPQIFIFSNGHIPIVRRQPMLENPTARAIESNIAWISDNENVADSELRTTNNRIAGELSKKYTNNLIPIIEFKNELIRMKKIDEYLYVENLVDTNFKNFTGYTEEHIIRLIYTRIYDPINIVNKDNMLEILIGYIRSFTADDVCCSGRFARYISVLAGIDPEYANIPNKQAIRNQIIDLVSNKVQTYLNSLPADVKRDYDNGNYVQDVDKALHNIINETVDSYVCNLNVTEKKYIKDICVSAL